MIQGLLVFLRGGRADLYAFERHILEGVQSHLREDSRSRLRRQIAEINKVQRLFDGKEVNLYRIRYGKPMFDDRLRFPDSRDESLLASVTLSDSEKHGQLKAEVWLAKGRLFSLVFNESPKRFFSGANLKSAQARILDLKIWFDPMQPRSVVVGKPIDGSRLTGWLGEWYSKGPVANLHSPLSQAEREVYLRTIDAQLPPDYLELVEETEGARLSNCVVLGVASIRKIVGLEENYYVLAEIEGLGVLAVQAGSQDAKLYFLSYEGSDVRPAGPSLKQAVADLMKLE